MANTPVILAQLSPAALTETALYVCPKASHSVLQQIIGCNPNNSGVKLRVSITVGGGATTTKDYFLNDYVLAGNSSGFFNFGNVSGVSLNPSDVIRVYADAANVSFTLIGALS